MQISIFDEIPIFRTGLEHVLSQQADISVVGQGGTPDDLFALVEKSKPDILIVGTDCLTRHAPELTELKQRLPHVRVVIMTASETQDDVTAALQLGAAAYILRSIVPSDVVKTLRMIMRGETFITPSLATRLFLASQSAKATGDQLDAQMHSLTDRERDVLRELTLGRTNKEIARNLELTEKTVKYHMGRLMQKLRARNRTEAALRVREVAF